jgi:hypothetical protein
MKDLIKVKDPIKLCKMLSKNFLLGYDQTMTQEKKTKKQLHLHIKNHINGKTHKIIHKTNLS